MSSAAKGEAAEYSRQGWSPIPIKERSKEPNLLELRPYLNRKATKEELEAWEWPGVGIVTGPLSGVLVLDVDGPKGEAELRKHGHPATPMVRTAGGGLHLYFKHPAYEVKTGIRIAPGFDVKASGGYVVAPPTVGPNGTRYEWIVSPEEAELADPPDWLMSILRSRHFKAPAGPVGERIPEGGRNKALASIAGTMRRRGMGEAEILAALEVANAQRCEPPLEAGEVAKIAASVARYEPAGDVVHVSFNGHGSPQRPQEFNLTDLGNAERLVARHGPDLRYCAPLGGWFVWDGRRWKLDDTGEVVRRAKETVRAVYPEAASVEVDAQRKALVDHARRSEARQRIEAMIALASTEPGVPVRPEEFDTELWSLNVLNGTLELRTGTLRDHNRNDLITKLAPVEYDPDAAAPRFERFLREVLPDEDVAAFVRRFAGYSLTGSTRERVLAILYGTGKNGKSTFVELVRDVLGDYAKNAAAETVLQKRYEGVGNEVAALKGARFVSAAETEKGRKLAEAKVKNLTGSDTVTARFLFAEPFDFRPEFKLWLSTNNKPEISGTDDAIWDRLRPVPFEQRFDGSRQDSALPEKLREELPGVLAWMVRGCLEWQRDGLGEPEKVRDAARAYREEMDPLADFINDCCVIRPDVWCRFATLYAKYERWGQEANELVKSKGEFGRMLKERGFPPDYGTGNVAIRKGIGLRSDHNPDGGRVNAPAAAGDAQEAQEAGNGANGINSVNATGEGINSQSTCKPGDSEEELTGVNPKTMNFEENPSRSEGFGNALTGINALTPGGSRRPIPEEKLPEYRRLVAEGMGPAEARAHILGEVYEWLRDVEESDG